MGEIPRSEENEPVSDPKTELYNQYKAREDKVRDMVDKRGFNPWLMKEELKKTKDKNAKAFLEAAIKKLDDLEDEYQVAYSKLEAVSPTDLVKDMEDLEGI